jgi:SAM-dependent methyltransferase
MRILDATAGTRMMWYQKHCPLATYIDIRPEVEPDIVMDCTHTSFPDGTFDLILFDPPHKNLGASSVLLRPFGHFTHAEIYYLVENAFIEFNRILKNSGVVVLKWNTHSIKLSRILAMAAPHFTPLFGQRVSYHNNGESSTYWTLLCKSKEVNHEIPGMD